MEREGLPESTGRDDSDQLKSCFSFAEIEALVSGTWPFVPVVQPQLSLSWGLQEYMAPSDGVLWPSKGE